MAREDLPTEMRPAAENAPESTSPAPEAVAAPAPPVVQASAVPEPPKRTRRTKAEMAAARAAAAGAPVEPVAPQKQTPHAAPVDEYANPFAGRAQAITAVLNAPDAATATRAAGEALRAQATEPEAAAPDESVEEASAAPILSPSADVQSWIAAKEQELINVEGIECLKLSRNFISKFGFPRYQRVFMMTGNSPEIAKYTKAQRLRHVAAMAYLEAHPNAA